MAAVVAPVTLCGRRPRALVSVHGVADRDYPTASLILRLAGLPVVACGEGIAAALREHGVRVCATVANGVGPPAPAAERSGLMRRWSLDDRLRLVVSVGRLVPQKNHQLAIRALAEVPGAALAILGEGPMRAQLVDTIRGMGMAQQVVIDGTWADARPVIAAADAMMLPSHWEGLPLVALEALAAHTPLVAAEVRGLRELLSDGKDALLVPADDHCALADALRRVLSDRHLCTRLTDAGAVLASRYSEAAMVTAYGRLYATLRGRSLAGPSADSQPGSSSERYRWT
jgi:glycosyltransferase involved in cell wall biosynthesis